MATALTALANVTLGASAATVTFSSINQNFKDLILVANVKNATSTTSFRIKMNSATSTNSVRMRGTSAAAASELFAGVGAVTQGTSNTYALPVISHIFDYTSSKHKNILTRSTDENQTEATVTRWADTAAVTSLVLSVETYNLAAGSSFALYGVS